MSILVCLAISSGDFVEDVPVAALRLTNSLQALSKLAAKPDPFASETPVNDLQILLVYLQRCVHVSLWIQRVNISNGLL